MNKTIIAYILSCIEEFSNDRELGETLRPLQQTMFQQCVQTDDEIIQILYHYMCQFPNDEELGFFVRRIYTPLNLYFEDDSTNTCTDCN